MDHRATGRRPSTNCMRQQLTPLAPGIILERTVNMAECNKKTSFCRLNLLGPHLINIGYFDGVVTWGTLVS